MKTFKLTLIRLRADSYSNLKASFIFLAFTLMLCPTKSLDKQDIIRIILIFRLSEDLK